MRLNSTLTWACGNNAGTFSRPARYKIVPTVLVAKSTEDCAENLRADKLRADKLRSENLRSAQLGRDEQRMPAMRPRREGSHAAERDA